MKVTMATVMSVDARITQGDKVKTSFWRSVEDGRILKDLISQHQVLVTGRHTYEVVQPKPNKQHLMVVLTTKSEEFAERSVPGRLEFLSLKPAQLINYLESKGYTSALLLGGSSNVDFLKAGLVDDLYLTLEPALFGDGLPLIEYLPAAMPLTLRKVEQLNRQGTLLLHYEVIKNTTVATAD